MIIVFQLISLLLWFGVFIHTANTSLLKGPQEMLTYVPWPRRFQLIVFVLIFMQVPYCIHRFFSVLSKSFYFSLTPFVSEQNTLLVGFDRLPRKTVILFNRSVFLYAISLDNITLMQRHVEVHTWYTCCNIRPRFLRWFQIIVACCNV